MFNLKSGVEGEKAEYGFAKNILTGLGYSLGGHWDYDWGIFDAFLSSNIEETIYLRLPFHTLRGEMEQADALIEFEAPYVVKHVVNTGLDKDGNSPLDATGLSQFQDPLDTDGEIKRKRSWENIANKAVNHIEDALNDTYDEKVIVDKKAVIQVLNDYLSDQKKDIQLYGNYISRMRDLPEKNVLYQIQKEHEHQAAEIVDNMKFLGGKVVKGKAKKRNDLQDKAMNQDAMVRPSSMVVEFGEEIADMEKAPMTAEDIFQPVKQNLEKGVNKKEELLDRVPNMGIFYLICDHMNRDQDQLREWIQMERLEEAKTVVYDTH